MKHQPDRAVSPSALRMRKTRAARKAAGPTRQIRKDSRWDEPEVLHYRASMKRWRDLLMDIPGYDPFRDSEGYKFVRKRAYDAIRFFHDQLSHAKGEKARTPFYLEPWQQAVIANLFGWVDVENPKKRRYLECFLYVPRKNGKTPLAAGIIILRLNDDGIYGEELYGIGHDYKQASLVFAHAQMMVRHNPVLLEPVHKIYNGQGQEKKILLTEDHGYTAYMPTAYDPDAFQGRNLSSAVVDEVHTHPSRDMIDAVITGTAGKPDPLVVYLTTADYERPQSPCNQLHDKAVAVRDGTIQDPRFLPVLYQAEKEDDWTKPEVWRKANPNLGISVSEDYLARQCKKAQDDPTYENVFKRFHLNIRTEQDTKWLPTGVWANCSGIKHELGEKTTCYGGLDLAYSRDMTAFSLLFPHDDGTYSSKVWFWIPRDRAPEQEVKDRVPYSAWHRDGHIEYTPGKTTDWDFIAGKIRELKSLYRIVAVGYDPYNARYFADRVEKDSGITFVEVHQGARVMSEPTRLLGDAIRDGKMRHASNPCMDWQVANVVLKVDGNGNVKPDKEKSGDKIDGVVALIMSMAVCRQQPVKPSVYSGRGVLVV